MTDTIVILAGPTASGKSRLAIDIARAHGGVVINADSMQLYRELNLLTARPDADEMAVVPHRLYGVVPAAEACSAARWRDMALAEIAAARTTGRLPIVVGGTGLYLRALTDGLAPVPDIPPDVRAAARALHARLGGAAFHARLAERDADAAARLAPGDSHRLIRAWEVIEATGASLAEWQRRQTGDGGLDGRLVRLVLMPPRAALYDRCDARLVAMVERGVLDEVAALLGLGLAVDLPAMKAVGVPELARHIAGEAALETAIAAAQQATRRYAKRQLTWFRHQMVADWTLKALYPGGSDTDAVAEIGRFLVDRLPASD